MSELREQAKNIYEELLKPHPWAKGVGVVQDGNDSFYVRIYVDSSFPEEAPVPEFYEGIRIKIHYLEDLELQEEE